MTTKMLFRSRSDRWIAGVCGGLGRYFTVDSNAIRLAFVLLALWRGIGILVYLVMAVILPDEAVREVAAEPGLPPPQPQEEEPQRRARLLGALMVLGGAYLLIRDTQVFHALLEDRGLGGLLVLGGILLLLLRSGQRT